MANIQTAHTRREKIVVRWDFPLLDRDLVPAMVGLRATNVPSSLMAKSECCYADVLRNFHAQSVVAIQMHFLENRDTRVRKMIGCKIFLSSIFQFSSVLLSLPCSRWPAQAKGMSAQFCQRLRREFGKPWVSRLPGLLQGLGH